MWDRISALLHVRKMSMSDLSKATGIPYSTIASWKSKAKPSAANLKTISERCGVSLRWLMGDDTELEPVDLPAASDMIRVPILGRVPAGVPIAAITDIEDWIPVPSSWSRGADVFALRIRGDSMEPLIHDGSIVIVRVQDCCDPGDVCIVSVNGGEDATCKKVFWSEKGVVLQSMNPAYPPMHYTPQEVRDLPVRIVGKVEHSINDL